MQHLQLFCSTLIALRGVARSNLLLTGMRNLSWHCWQLWLQQWRCGELWSCRIGTNGVHALPVGVVGCWSAGVRRWQLGTNLLMTAVRVGWHCWQLWVQQWCCGEFWNCIIGANGVRVLTVGLVGRWSAGYCHGCCYWSANDLWVAGCRLCCKQLCWRVQQWRCGKVVSCRVDDNEIHALSVELLAVRSAVLRCLLHVLMTGGRRKGRWQIEEKECKAHSK